MAEDWQGMELGSGLTLTTLSMSGALGHTQRAGVWAEESQL
jgi:hypothetical protein